MGTDDLSGLKPYRVLIDHEDTDGPMLNSTPEYVSAHLNDLADKPPKASPELIARYRADRRNRLRRLAAGISRATPFVRRNAGGEVATQEPGL